MADWPDKIQAISSVVSAGAAFFVLVSIRQASSAMSAQNASTGMATVLSIWEKLDEHWCRFREAGEADKNFEFGQLISYYEMASRLFRDGIFKTRAAFTLYEHLHEILSIMQSSAEFNQMFADLQSRPETFENINWLCSQPPPAIYTRAVPKRYRRFLRMIGLRL